MSLLQTLKFKCINKNCEEILEYAKALDHLDKCPEKLSSCILKCERIVKNKFMEIHCLKDCDQNLFKCDSCDLKIAIKNFDKHNCKEDLKSHLKNFET